MLPFKNNIDKLARIRQEIEEAKLELANSPANPHRVSATSGFLEFDMEFVKDEAKEEAEARRNGSEQQTSVGELRFVIPPASLFLGDPRTPEVNQVLERLLGVLPEGWQPMRIPSERDENPSTSDVIGLEADSAARLKKWLREQIAQRQEEARAERRVNRPWVPPHWKK